MNQQYQELAEQAGLKVESWMTNPPRPFQILGSTEQFEKFVELIVRECVAICEDTDGEHIADAKWGRRCCALEIKQHFGVEE
jgi:hypothetical protein